ncbi:MAG: hypothetical protein HQL69_21315 [Magnetococcales bacterium]|nr:hypothetical protein [Magnetococcales bacterium]
MKWNVLNKLLAGFAIVLLLLLAITAIGVRAMLYSEEFVRNDFARAVAAADGSMESRINHFAYLLAVLDSRNNLDATSQSYSQKRMDKLDKRFKQALAKLESSRHIAKQEVADLNNYFALLAEKSHKIIKVTASQAKLMDALDYMVASFFASNNQQMWTVQQTNTIWSYVMAANDFAAYGLAKYQKDYEKLRPKVKNLAKISARIDHILESGDALVNNTLVLSKVRSELDSYAQTIDKLLENVEKGSDSRVGTDEYVMVVQQKMLHMAKSATHQMLLFGLLGLLMGVAITVVIAKLVVVPLRKAVYAASISSSQIAVSMTEQERIAAQQAVSVTEINATMEQLGVSARQALDLAEVAAQGASSAMELAAQGVTKVNATLDSMGKTKESVDAIVQYVMQLSEQIEQISDVTAMVTDFSSEIKMLAMNAAVEAVRAGEHGRGFAVLAVETRKLAEESKRSAGRINDLLQNIQNVTNGTVIATEDGGKMVDAGVKITQETAQTFHEVTDTIQVAAEGAQQIADNVRQQALVIRQAVEAMRAIHGSSKESASGISQVKASIQTLDNVAQSLKRVV